MTRVRIYHDVDGVLNAQMPLKEWGAKPENGKASITDFRGTETWPIRWSPGYVEALNALGDKVELVWTTTWRENALTDIAPLVGITLPHQRVLHPLDGVTRFPSIMWKRDAIGVEQELDPSPFVWLEDEAGILERTISVELGGYTPWINHRLGVTPKIFDRIKAYVEAEDRSNIDLWDSDWKTPLDKDLSRYFQPLDPDYKGEEAV